MCIMMCAKILLPLHATFPFDEEERGMCVCVRVCVFVVAAQANASTLNI